MRRWRLAVGGVLALLVTAVAGARVFAPAETFDRSQLRQPAAVTVDATVAGELMSAPLLVDSRLRVYAADNRIWADGPINTRLGTSALWAYRRWPAQVVGVVVTGHTVVSKWSDGQLVAIDADQRRIAWRATGPVGATAYQGRRTGARTVYDPPDLFLGTTKDGAAVVVSEGADVSAFDAASGRRLWNTGLPDRPDCRVPFTAPDRFVVLHRCGPGGPTQVFDLGTGTALPDLDGAYGHQSPVGCEFGRSRCAGLGDEVFSADGSLTPAHGLVAGAWLAGRTALSTTAAGTVVATDAATGARVWSWSGFAGEALRIVAVEPDTVHLLTAGHGLVTLSLADGTLRSWVSLHIDGEEDAWKPGYVYAAHGLVVIERLLPDGRPDQPDTAYYYGFPTMIFTGS